MKPQDAISPTIEGVSRDVSVRCKACSYSGPGTTFVLESKIPSACFVLKAQKQTIMQVNGYHAIMVCVMHARDAIMVCVMASEASTLPSMPCWCSVLEQSRSCCTACHWASDGGDS